MKLETGTKLKLRRMGIVGCPVVEITITERSPSRTREWHAVSEDGSVWTLRGPSSEFETMFSLIEGIGPASREIFNPFVETVTREDLGFILLDVNPHRNNCGHYPCWVVEPCDTERRMAEYKSLGLWSDTEEKAKDLASGRNRQSSNDWNQFLNG